MYLSIILMIIPYIPKIVELEISYPQQHARLQLGKAADLIMSLAKPEFSVPP